MELEFTPLYEYVATRTSYVLCKWRWYQHYDLQHFSKCYGRRAQHYQRLVRRGERSCMAKANNPKARPAIYPNRAISNGRGNQLQLSYQILRNGLLLPNLVRKRRKHNRDLYVSYLAPLLSGTIRMLSLELIV